MTGSTIDDDATARAFIAYYLHDIAASAAEDGHPALITAARAERTAWERDGRLAEVTAHCVHGWAVQNTLKAELDAIFGSDGQDGYTRAKADQEAVERWLTANGYRVAAHP